MKSQIRIGIAAAIALTMTCIAAQAQVTKGDFTSQGVNWTTNGNVQFVAVGIHSNGVALFQEPGEGTRPGAGSRARIYQSADMTGEPAIVFRYRLSAGSGTRDSAVPPDSFTASLFNTTAGRRVIPKQAADAPDFSNGFYYSDADGAEVFDPSIVSVIGPDGDGMKTVTLSVSTTGTARVEFGFASADNGVTSAVFLDDVASDCAASNVYCCSPSGVATVIDDGKPCTYDECQSDGSVTHDLFDCCGACDNNRAASTAIMIMIDVSATMPDEEIDATTNAVKQLLNRFRGESNPPLIGVGTFWEVVDAQVRQDPTANYDLVESVLGSIVSKGGPSALKNAIEDAASTLGSVSPPADRNYIILITDGWTSLPRTNPGQGVDDSCQSDCCLSPPGSNCGTGADCLCGCSPARDAAEAAADSAQSNGIEIFVAHYVGLVEPTSVWHRCFDASWRADAIAWMEAEIATTPDHIFKNTDVADELANCAMTSMVELINCDDLDNCTTDSCIEGLCVHTPIAGCVP